ncbi:MAG: c-type cytochrome biogenesis protein CcmI [gamma proteobacterium symbiont of Taylorina sp.]|nr:c-type cytochrome biogenesis protein CcmI [gamma proteobacterium symbiont of Taylorina sp.]
MWILWVCCAVLLIIAVVSLVRPLFKTYSASELAENQKQADQRKALNIELYEQKKVQIEQDYDNALLDDEAKKQAYNEIEHSLIQDAATSQNSELVQLSNKNAKNLSFVFLFFIPVFSISVYAFIMPQNFQQVVMGETDSTQQNSQQQAPDIASMITSLEGKLKESPDNIQGWNMLARSYVVMKRYQDAVSAYEKTLELNKTAHQEIPDLEINYVEALMQVGEKESYKKARGMLASMLKADPDNGDALWFKGFVDYEAGDKVSAVKLWTHLLTILPAEGEQANIVNTYLARVVSELNKELPADKQIVIKQTQSASQSPVSPPSGPAPGQKMTGSKEEQTFIANMIARVEQRVKDNPQDIASWKKLAKSYDVLGRFTDSANAYAKAVEIDNTDIDSLMNYADAVIKTGEIDQLNKARIVFAQLLDKNSNNADALYLSGLLARTAGDVDEAKLFWGNLLPLLPKGSPAYKNVESNLNSLQ